MSTQDRCIVCAECTMGKEIAWAPPMVLLGLWKLVFIRLVSVSLGTNRCTVCAECTSGVEIILGTSNVIQILVIGG
jgi:hypothetical protein